ncbi:hypothetical protein [Metabacillus arenae]|uniref:Uncharacterized protein n=1 Tax=Metabacillus arenae TaxID=2771434 RepID=A0A926S1H5_9BACI|nr:hypothetical protein [Metabacillus arenae]MBD1381019.1 hypothetical protein [Metabacillus arenae]
MKVTFIKGPNFEQTEKEAYKYLYKILRKQVMEDLRMKMKKDQKDNK